MGALESALDIQVGAAKGPKCHLIRLQNDTEKAGVHIAGILNVKVLQITDVRRREDRFVAANPYLILYIKRLRQEHKHLKTSVKQNEVNAEWNEEFTLYVENIRAQRLFILVNNVVSVKKHDYLGKAVMKLTYLTPEIPVICKLDIMGESYDHIGDLKIEVVYKPFAYDCIPTSLEDVTSLVQKAPVRTPKGGGLLIIIIHGAYLYREKDHAHSSVSLLFRGQLRKTQSMMNTNRPIWLQEFTFMLEQPPMNDNLHIKVINNSWLGLFRGKGSLGHTNIRLADVVKKKWTNELYQLKSSYFDKDHQYGKCNYLQVELCWRTSD
ncbi:hypothetical protein M8C21_027360 [Ambrosia artemisiifolia]|uniref:C2 domain-containing protein n=1 Tax=Ambrosia artemisiifolia TaxID=4212 RepID=A0AAD5BN28_AMBAR|nr:hypothetical protein M8C21_027360 [Ambrosia artemisiifolia]